MDYPKSRAKELKASLKDAQNNISYAFNYEQQSQFREAYDLYHQAAKTLEPLATYASNDEAEYEIVQQAYKLYSGLVGKVEELAASLGPIQSSPQTSTAGDAELDVEDKGGDMASYGSSGPSYTRSTASSSAKYGSNPYNPPKTYRGSSGYESRNPSSSAAAKRTSYNPSSSIDADKKKKAAEEKDEAMLKKCQGSDHCKGINEENIKRIINECCEAGNKIRFADITGLDFVKQTLNELIVLPARKPELFTGLRAPTKGILLFGPPGNGKTMIGRAISVESGMNFMSISASSLTSKWVGEAETNVRAMFAVARAIQPTVLFVDEIDSILCSRGSGEQESSRRLKTEMLVQMDGIRSDNEDKLLVIAATNRPEELDDAVLRRLPKRVYVPLPEQCIREELVKSNLKKVNSKVTPSEVTRIATQLEGYSCSDIAQLIKEAVMEPVRDIVKSGNFNYVQSETDIRPVESKDFTYAMKVIRPSLEGSSLKAMEIWAQKHGVSGL